MELIEALRETNPWWHHPEVPERRNPATRREELELLIGELASERITGIIGGRRAGKTTMMYQMIAHLMGQGVEPKRILYFSADDPAIRTLADSIDDVIKEYFARVVGDSPRAMKTYILIDEIHHAKDWEGWLKRYHDMGHPIKFIVSGSSATHLLKRSSDSLVGRISETYVHPISFREYLCFREQLISQIGYKSPPRANLFRFEEIYDNLVRTMDEQYEIKNSVMAAFEEYLEWGAMPERFHHDDLGEWRRVLISDAVEKTIYKDILELYGVKNPANIEKLLFVIASNQSSTFSFASLGEGLSLDNESVANYTSYLKSAFLIGMLNCFSRSAAKTVRKNKKLFILDSGVRNALIKTREEDRKHIPPIVESTIQSHLLARASRKEFSVYYWRGKSEVDAVLDGENLVPIEVKYTNRMDKKDLKGIMEFSKTFGTDKGIMVTKDILKLERVNGVDILHAPAWLFTQII